MESSPNVIVLAHGAGASSQSAWMRAWARRLSSIAPTTTFDYPYMQKKRRVPDPLPVLIEAHRQAVAEVQAKHDARLVLAGKSMGSRVGCHLSLDDPSVQGLVCFGYPLVAPGKSGAVRSAVLLELRAPILFLQGTRDPLCPLEQLDAIRARMQAPSRLFIVEGGDHSLVVSRTELKAKGRTQAEVDQDVLAEIARFLASPPGRA